MFEVGYLLADKLFQSRVFGFIWPNSARSGRLEVQVVEPGEDSDLGAALLGSFGSRGGVGYLSSRYSLMTSDSGMSRPSASSAGVLPSGLIFAYSGELSAAARNRPLSSMLSPLLINDEPGLGGEIGEIHVVELHRCRFLALLKFSIKFAYRRRPGSAQTYRGGQPKPLTPSLEGRGDRSLRLAAAFFLLDYEDQGLGEVVWMFQLRVGARGF